MVSALDQTCKEWDLTHSHPFLLTASPIALFRVLYRISPALLQMTYTTVWDILSRQRTVVITKLDVTDEVLVCINLFKCRGVN